MTTQLLQLDEIKQFFPGWRKDVLKNFLLIVHCIIRCRTVSLYKCRAEAGAILQRRDLKLESIYKQFIRFFKMKWIDGFCMGIAWLIISISGLRTEAFLVMDRTNWKLGGIDINVLFIGLLLPNGCFLPIVWKPLAKKGNSGTEERKALMERFQKAWRPFNSLKINVLADREFIGAEWFQFLSSCGFSFVIRLRYQDHLGLVAASIKKTVAKTDGHIRRRLRRDGFFQAGIEMLGNTYTYVVFPNTGSRKGTDEFVVLLSDMADAAKISAAYRKRWGIEVFFLHCKTNGFNMEDLNFKDLEKVQLLMALAAVAYVFSLLNGLIKECVKPIALKNYRDKKARSISLFRLGFDNLKNTLHVLADLMGFLIEILAKSHYNPRELVFSHKSVQ
jgi:hypothetical protein